jgi:hypothetical protein
VKLAFENWKRREPKGKIKQRHLELREVRSSGLGNPKSKERSLSRRHKNKRSLPKKKKKSTTNPTGETRGS